MPTYFYYPHGTLSHYSLHIHDLVLELRREALIRDKQLLPLLDQLAHLLLQIRPRLRFQARKLHVQRLLARANRGLLELSVM